MVGTILVTGATGSVGSELVKQLSSARQKVRAPVHSPTKEFSKRYTEHKKRNVVY